MTDERGRPALDLFWEEADLDDAGEHPLRRELAHRLDVLARYEQMLADAHSRGHNGLIATITRQHRAQLRLIEQLEDALQRHAERGASRRDDEHTGDGVSSRDATAR
jgi:hypothetical protein